ncbi:hypothetical protein JH06_2377 [Blastocystis sp. subtype 4]|uniref:hypothetical protein n=1 Tax=Blastocystis sp. subtype 4 TaxID=944170 RepID=UPI00071171D6|nr:hypothetical protein JH06_2377 [Blastocystis sp. subtype 4]KNB43702.1 hypothetical protein JH06_2377 [Blastocystis sp. subtype 4]|eukprot:XP_014527145.1 hypothetical protein JH06_2377 [Blastocystis sp. subtype 4]
MSSPSAILIDSQGSVVTSIGPKCAVNLSSCSGIMLNMYNRVKDLVPGESPVLTLETNKFKLIETKRNENLVCIIEGTK